MATDRSDDAGRSRRAVLRSAGVATGLGLAGCLETTRTSEPAVRDATAGTTDAPAHPRQSTDAIAPEEPTAITATTDFDSGGGVEIRVDEESSHVTLTLSDNADYPFLGYLHFRLDGVRRADVSFEFTNLDNSRMPAEYRLQYTSNLEAGEWQRMDETVGGGFSQSFDADTVYVSNYKAYPYRQTVERVTGLEAAAPAFVETTVIGQSHEGRDMHAIRVTDPETDDAAKEDIVCIARQHPGEVEGSWHMDAVIDRVLESLRGRASTGAEDYVFHFLPNANPDGMYAGLHRHCRQGYDLNRHWDAESPVEIENLKTYLRAQVDDLYWGFDFHSSTNPDYDAALYSDRVATAADRGVIEAIAAHSQSYPDQVRGSRSGGHAHGFVADAFDAVMVVTEAWTYHEYSSAALAAEAEQFLGEVVPIAD